MISPAPCIQLNFDEKALSCSAVAGGDSIERWMAAAISSGSLAVRAPDLSHMLSTRQDGAGFASSDSTAPATRCGARDLMHPFQLQAAKVLPS